MTSAVTQRECVKVRHYNEESVYQTEKAAAWGWEHVGFQKKTESEWKVDYRLQDTYDRSKSRGLVRANRFRPDKLEAAEGHDHIRLLWECSTLVS